MRRRAVSPCYHFSSPLPHERSLIGSETAADCLTLSAITGGTCRSLTGKTVRGAISSHKLPQTQQSAATRKAIAPRLGALLRSHLPHAHASSLSATVSCGDVLWKTRTHVLSSSKRFFQCIDCIIQEVLYFVKRFCNGCGGCILSLFPLSAQYSLALGPIQAVVLLVHFESHDPVSFLKSIQKGFVARGLLQDDTASVK